MKHVDSPVYIVNYIVTNISHPDHSMFDLLKLLNNQNKDQTKQENLKKPKDKLLVKGEIGNSLLKKVKSLKEWGSFSYLFIFETSIYLFLQYL